MNDNDAVSIGPDLNASRSPLDKKLYRQVILKSNGLRCVLVSDVPAMSAAASRGEDLFADSDDDDDDNNSDDDDDDDDNGDESKEERTERDNKDSEGEDDDNDDDDDDDEYEGGIRPAAAAVLVQGGSFHDPKRCQGLAHFLEHALFLGTEKYPGENSYDKFLSRHGGSDNAFTEAEHTLYHLEIGQRHLASALERLASFFVCPLLRGDALERELNAVDSEFKLSKNADDCRMGQLLTLSCREAWEGGEEEPEVEEEEEGSVDVKLENNNNINKNKRRKEKATNGKKKEDKVHHPYGIFSWGNVDSLKHVPEQNDVNVPDELRKFYDSHYYALNMRVAIVGAFSLDTLQSEFVRCFSEVPRLPRLTPDDEEGRGIATMTREKSGTWEETISHNPLTKVGMPLPSKSLGRIYRIVPVKVCHRLVVTWQLPSQRGNWRSKPCDLIAHLLGHEANGSLLSALRRDQLADGLMAGVSSDGDGDASSHALFTLDVTLSEGGVEKWMDVVDLAYQYLGMIRRYFHHEEGVNNDGSAGDSGGLPSWIYKEVKTMCEAGFQYADEQSPTDLVEILVESSATTISGLPPERILDGNECLFEFNANIVKNLLDDYIIPTNSRVDLMSSLFGCESEGTAPLSKSSLEKFVEDDINTNAIATRLDESEDNNNNDDKNRNYDENDDSFSLATAEKPLLEPFFGTQYWSRVISQRIMKKWACSWDYQNHFQQSIKSGLSLPPVNPYVPTKFELYPHKEEDSSHPLLHCSLKVRISVGKRKSWFPATVIQYDRVKNCVLLSYEDEEEKWHLLDDIHMSNSSTDDCKKVVDSILPNFEGTMDHKTIKFRVVSVPEDGEGAVLKYGDDNDLDVEDGIHFPPIPPALPKSRLPSLITDTKQLKLWHLQDRKFNRPIAELRINIISEKANQSPFMAACADLLAIVASDALTETCYLASVCELGSSLTSTDSGFYVRVYGFDDRLLDLAGEVLRLLFAFRQDLHADTGDNASSSVVKPGRLSACRDILFRRYGNAGLCSSSLCSGLRLRCLRSTPPPSAFVKKEALLKAKDEDFYRGAAELLRQVRVEALFHGNVDIESADNASNMIKDVVTELSTSSSLLRRPYPPVHMDVRILPSFTDGIKPIVVPTIDPGDPNTAVEIYYQIGKDDIRNRVLIDLLEQIMEEPFYNQLRTKEVSCGARWTYGVMGLCFKIVTSSKSADDVIRRIEQFLIDFRKDLPKMTNEAFMESLVGLSNNKLQKFDSLEEESSILWSEITERRYDWEVHRNEVLSLRSIQKDDIIKAYDEWICPERKGCRKLVVNVIGNGNEASSNGRPDVQVENIPRVIDEIVETYNKSAGNKTWGVIY